MKIKNKSIRGCFNYIPKDMIIFRLLEKKIMDLLNSYSYCEIQFPIIERTELFERSIGMDSDILSKEMYNFKDKSNESITLRPEGTIGCVRSIIDNGFSSILENRLWYIGPMFRYERPQYGRYRQFNQLGIEVFGIKSPEIELELLMIISNLWKVLGLSSSIYLEINSIGSIESRKNYIKALVSFLKKHKSKLDEDCIKRLRINPLRILDTKNIHIQRLLEEAPMILNYLDDSSLGYFENLCRLMKLFGLKYVVNVKLVRGLDYYNDTVFEWKVRNFGSQNTVCGGGRYDYLFEKIGGKPTSAIGCALGIERLMLLVKKEDSFIKKTFFAIDVYIIYLGNKNSFQAIRLSENIRSVFPKLRTKIDFSTGNISNKLRKAKKSNTNIVLILGDKEVKENTVLFKNFKKNIQLQIPEKNIIKKIKETFCYEKILY